ncbi:hypothetical protein WJX73_008193 [Symbiochloris irregularis]|uniref:UDP-glucose 6-dehydrogenase n=1 Tax=Symbiochloris irregularis TaxID=706552 RepID=A0AAW1NVD4_9CHLO
MWALKIACIGAGYVGGPTMAMIAYKCPDIEVTVVDINEARISAWKSDILPIYEPGLDHIVKAARDRGNLQFSSDVTKHVAAADIIFVSVNTPTKVQGVGAGKAADLTYWEKAARMIATVSTTSKIVVEKSTVLRRNCRDPSIHFEILSNPEFLAEGTAIADLESPDRVLIGGKETVSGRRADVQQVGHAIGTDSRIGHKFLNASVGFGGSCFQKDILNLVYICETVGLQQVADYWHSVVHINNYQKQRFVGRIIEAMFNTISGKIVTVLGFAFKKDTGDTRETPAIDVCKGLLNDNAQLHIHDPKVSEAQIRQDLATSPFQWDHPGTVANCKAAERDSIRVFDNAVDACKDSHAIVVLTEWKEFAKYDYTAIWDTMVKPAFIFDGRNVLDHDHLRSLGFIVYALGKPLDPFIQRIYS